MTIVISVENLSKTYRLGQIGTGTFTNDLKIWWAKTRGKPNPLLKIGDKDHGNLDCEDLWALRDVSFKVEQGEVLGIIGRNGAGKSTLLKILSRVTAPTFGRIKVKGRIASLLEVGTGFHPELTGRENIYLNGAILGMTKDEVRSKFDEIVGFSEIEKFIDTPVKRYSSGMYVRLAFAVAAHLDPEILVVDEVLAVGDAEFQKKCLGKMKDVATEGRTVLFVSHNMAAVNSLCQNAICLHRGILMWRDHTHLAIEKYLTISSDGAMTSSLDNRIDRVGNGQVRITNLSVVGSDSIAVDQVVSGQDISLVIDYIVPSGATINQAVCIIVVKTLLGQPLFSCSTRLYHDYLPPLKPKGKIICKINQLPLNEGSYYLDISIKQGQVSRNIMDSIEQAALLNVIAGDYFNSGRSANKQSSPVLVNHAWLVS